MVRTQSCLTIRISRRSFVLLTTSTMGSLFAHLDHRLSAFAQSPVPTSLASSGSFFDSSAIHDIVATFDQADYDAIITAYQETGSKKWLKAQLTIDGRRFENVGLRLKGNSSLQGLRGGIGRDLGNRTPPQDMPDFATPPAGDNEFFSFGMQGSGTTISADEPASLPWLVRLDKYVSGQQNDGLSEFVIRSNNTATALNEALALDLLTAAGLPSQAAAYIRFSANEDGPRLRLAIENPDDTWMEAHFPDLGILFKAEADGNWMWNDDDLGAYIASFDLEAGGGDDEAANYAPLIAFLDFINNSDDATFASDLSTHLDIDKFAVYLAMMDLIQNFDAIDGPGNNAYLFYDETTDMMTVVPWDMNLAFGGMGRMGGMGGGNFRGGGRPIGNPAIDGTPVPGSFQPPVTVDGGTPIIGQPAGDSLPPSGFEPRFTDTPGTMRGFGGMNNPLVTRWNANDMFVTLQAETKTRLSAALFEHGVASEILSDWIDILETQATDLIDQEQIDNEAESLQGQIDAA